jgi:hypothetical protein
MLENNPSNVSSGFEMLLEEIEAEIEFFTRIGSRAFESRDFRKVDEARTQAEKITAFRDKVAALRKEWDAIGGEDGRNRIEIRLENETVWLTQQHMVELFHTTKQNIGQHLKNNCAEVA